MLSSVNTVLVFLITIALGLHMFVWLYLGLSNFLITSYYSFHVACVLVYIELRNKRENTIKDYDINKYITA